jgi:hypothetical protein
MNANEEITFNTEMFILINQTISLKDSFYLLIGYILSIHRVHRVKKSQAIFSFSVFSVSSQFIYLY